MRISRLEDYIPGILLVAFLIWQARRHSMSWLEIAFTGAALILGILLVVFFASFLFTRVKEPLIIYGDAKRSVDVDVSSPLNRGVLEYLRRSRPKRKAELESASPLSVKNPLITTGTHPEVGVRLWEELAAPLPVDCRWIVCGTPALVHPQAGVLFGVAIGTAYYLRVTDADMESALQAGASTEKRLSGGSILDLASEFGPGWVFGSWKQEELEWCRAEYEALGRTAAGEATPEEGPP